MLRLLVIALFLGVIAYLNVDAAKQFSEPPVRSVLIGDARSSGHENTELRQEYDKTLIERFERLSDWAIVDQSEFDSDLTGDPREEELHRLGIRYFLSASLSIDKNDLVYIRATLTDAWTERGVWQESYAGPFSDVPVFAEEVAKSVSEILGHQ